jgi:GTP cyclohydrolase I
MRSDDDLSSFTEEELIKAILGRIVGEEPDRQGLQETPKRYVTALAFWTKGYQEDPKSVLKEFEDGAQNYNEMVFQGAISCWSLCEHHLAPFFGVAHIGYIPNGKIVGLSKLSRLVDVFARRLQVQERLTRQIADALDENLKPKAVGVVLRCRHSCIESRGVQKAGSMTYTSALTGLFKDDISARSEFLKFVDRADAASTDR